MTCQSREENQRLGCLTEGWAYWHMSECILHAHFARHGIATKPLGSFTKGDKWTWFRRSNGCQIVREHGVGSYQDKLHRDEQYRLAQLAATNSTARSPPLRKAKNTLKRWA